jgi:hypothetical protein
MAGVTSCCTAIGQILPETSSEPAVLDNFVKSLFGQTVAVTAARSLRRFMGRKHGVSKKEPGGLAPCFMCGAVIDPTPWQVPVHGESSWFLHVCEKGSTVPFSSRHRRLRGGGEEGAPAILGRVQ